MMGCVVGRTEESRVLRHKVEHPAARAKCAVDAFQYGLVIVDVFKYVKGSDQIEVSLEWYVSGVDMEHEHAIFELTGCGPEPFYGGFRSVDAGFGKIIHEGLGDVS